jgi:hypothetical protein
MDLSIDSTFNEKDTRHNIAASSSSKGSFRPDSLLEKLSSVTVKDSLPSPDSTLSPGSAPTLIEKEEVNFWNPRALSRPVLAAFLILFMVMLGSLQIIHSYAARHHGLATSDQSKHYLWTFGPTASKLFLFSRIESLLINLQSL